MKKSMAQLAAEAAASGSSGSSEISSNSVSSFETSEITSEITPETSPVSATSMAGRKWTLTDQKELIRLSGSGENLIKLSQIFSRSPQAINSKLLRIGIHLYRSGSRLNLNLQKISVMLGVEKAALSHFGRTLEGKAIRGKLPVAKALLGIETAPKSNKEKRPVAKKVVPKIPKALKEIQPKSAKIAKNAKKVLSESETKTKAVKKPREPKQAKSIRVPKESLKKQWTHAEMQNLFLQSEQRMSIEEIATDHKRTMQAVARHIVMINPGAAPFYLEFTRVE